MEARRCAAHRLHPEFTQRETVLSNSSQNTVFNRFAAIGAASFY